MNNSLINSSKRRKDANAASMIVARHAFSHANLNRIICYEHVPTPRNEQRLLEAFEMIFKAMDNL